MEDFEMDFLNKWYGPDGGTEDGLIHREIGDEWVYLNPGLTLADDFAVEYINNVVDNAKGIKLKRELAVEATKCILANLLQNDLDYLFGIYIPRGHRKIKEFKDKYNVEWSTAVRLNAIVDYLVYTGDVEAEGYVYMLEIETDLYRLEDEWMTKHNKRSRGPIVYKKTIRVPRSDDVVF